LFYIAEHAPSLPPEIIKETIAVIHQAQKCEQRKRKDNWEEKKSAVLDEMAFVRRIENARVLVAGPKAAAEAARKGLGNGNGKQETPKIEEKPRAAAVLESSEIAKWIKKVCHTHVATERLKECTSSSKGNLRSTLRMAVRYNEENTAADTDEPHDREQESGSESMSQVSTNAAQPVKPKGKRGKAKARGKKGK